MKQKQIIISLIVVLCVGLGIWALIKSRGAASESGGDVTTPTIVTVQTGALKLATLHRYVAGYGTVDPAPATAEQPAAGAQLAAPSPGLVTKVNVVEGQQVEKGDVLAELNSQAAEQEVERQKKLYVQQNTSLKICRKLRRNLCCCASPRRYPARSRVSTSSPVKRWI